MMKKVSFIFSLLFLLSVNIINAQSADAAIKMAKEKYDIGKVSPGDAVTFDMEFVNQTKKPVVVKTVQAGCGCTVPEKPAEPILPGKTGKVKVSYKPSALGPVNRDVEIYLAGYTEPKIVYFTGEVVAKK